MSNDRPDIGRPDDEAWLYVARRIADVCGRAAQRRARGEVAVSNTAGSVHITGWDRNEVQVIGTLAQGARLDVETISGELTLSFKGSVDAEFDVESFSGEISNCFGPKASAKSEHSPAAGSCISVRATAPHGSGSTA